jgi:hypothetical protein
MTRRRKAPDITDGGHEGRGGHGIHPRQRQQAAHLGRAEHRLGQARSMVAISASKKSIWRRHASSVSRSSAGKSGPAN